MDIVFQVGPFIIKMTYIVFVVSALLAYGAVKFRLKGYNNGAKLLDMMVNGLIIAAVIWKFSYLLIHPIRAIKSPMSILFFNGDQMGIILGIIGALVYLLYQSKKNQISLNVYIELSMLSFIVFNGTKYLFLIFFNQAMTLLIAFLIHIVFYFIFTYKKSFPIQHKLLAELVLWVSVFQFLIDYFNQDTYTFIGPFTLQQVIFLAVALTSVLVQIQLNKKNH